MQNAWIKTANHNLRFQRKYKDIWDIKAKCRNFQPGDTVLLRSRIKMARRIGNKFYPGWDGAFHVVRVRTVMIYRRVWERQRNPTNGGINRK